MKRFYGFAMVALSGMMVLGSCSQEVLNEYQPVGEPGHELRVLTRSDTPVNESVVYLMDDTGVCIDKMEADALGGYMSASLQSGTYELFAIGSDDLGRWMLPSKEEAMAGCVISVMPDQPMGDLLMGHEHIQLTDGTVTTLDLELSRKVVCLKEMAISQVPTDVTGVTLAIAPVYGKIKLDGSFADQDTTKCEVTLAQEDQTGTWHHTGELYAFPSKGTPNIDITFQRGEAISQYRYKAEAPLTSNHQVSISGTYSEIQEGTGPVVGQSWQDYFVVSVDKEKRTAVLLRRTYETGIDTAEKMAKRAREISRPEGAITNAWRLPTEAECRIFLMATDIGNIPNNKDIVKGGYYYQEDSKVGRVHLFIEGDKRSLMVFPGVGYSDIFIYRPVIDVKW